MHLAGGKRSSSTRRCRSWRTSTAVESQRPRHARRAARRARPPAARARRRVGGQGVLGGVRAVAGVRGAVRAGRPVPGGGAAGRSRRCWSTRSRRNVVIATPTTLIALLRTVAYGWRQEALARNAAAVHQLGRELHARLATMGTHVAKLGRSLDGGGRQLQPARSRRWRPACSSRRGKLTELQVADGELAAPAPVERSPRRVSAPELVASADESLIALDHGRTDGAHSTTTARRVRAAEPSRPEFDASRAGAPPRTLISRGRPAPALAVRTRAGYGDQVTATPARPATRVPPTTGRAGSGRSTSARCSRRCSASPRSPPSGWRSGSPRSGSSSTCSGSARVGTVFHALYFCGCVLAMTWVRRRNLFGPVVRRRCCSPSPCRRSCSSGDGAARHATRLLTVGAHRWSTASRRWR